MCRYLSNASGFHPGFMLHCGVIGTSPRPREALRELMYGRWPGGGGAATGGERASSLHACRLQLPIQALSYKTTVWAVQERYSGRVQNRSWVQCGDEVAVWGGLALQWRKRKWGEGSVNDDLGQCPQRDNYILSYHTSCWLWTDLDLITFFPHSEHQNGS